jgi:hypothetical protein
MTGGRALLALVAELTTGAGIMLAVALDATFHKCHLRRSGGHIHFGNVSVAHLARHARREMGAMVPVHFRGNRVNPDPRNRILRFSKSGELLDGCTILRDGRMAGHALGCCRKRHVLTRIGIRMAILTLQAKGHVGFVAVRDRLCILRAEPQAQHQKRSENPHETIS